MKPRFRSADLTQEDWLAWLHARHGFHEIPWLQLIDAYEAADRRDADLMLWAQRNKDVGCYGTSIANAIPLRYDEWLAGNPLWGEV